MKSLTVALLVLAVFVPSAFPQSADDLHKPFLGWVGIVQTAENKYESVHGRYGKLTDLRKANLLGSLIFESDEPANAYAQTGSDTCVVPRGTCKSRPCDPWQN